MMTLEVLLVLLVITNVVLVIYMFASEIRAKKYERDFRLARSDSAKLPVGKYHPALVEEWAAKMDRLPEGSPKWCAYRDRLMEVGYLKP